MPEQVKQSNNESSTVSEKTLSLVSTQATTPAAPMNDPSKYPWLLSSPTGSTTSASKRICRICQMDTGIMVRPCNCAGTMGDVHEECLTKWVVMSKKKACEICKSEYAKSGEQFKPLKDWERPKISSLTILNIIFILALSLLVWYVVLVMRERYFWERLFTKNMTCRPDDTGRFVLMLILLASIMHNCISLYRTIKMYFNSQKCIRFIDKHE